MAGIYRKFKGLDNDLVREAEQICIIAGKDQNDFIDFNDVIFKPNFLEEFAISIRSAKEYIKETPQNGNNAIQKMDMKQLGEETKKHILRMKFIIERAFPDNYNVFQEFGLNELRSAQNSASRMIIFLDKLYNASVKYQDVLRTKGANDDLIEKTNVILDKLDFNRKRKVEDAKKTLPEEQEKKIELLNKVWESLFDIIEAAQVIYVDNPNKAVQYSIRTKKVDVSG